MLIDGAEGGDSGGPPTPLPSSAPTPHPSIAERLDELASRGVAIGNRPEAERFLLLEGYHAVIHGYGDAFLDREATERAGGDRYREGTSLEQFEGLYLADRRLRNEAMGCLMLAESAIKSCNVEALCEEYDDPEFYLRTSSYRPKRLYHPEPNHTYEMDLHGLLHLLGRLYENQRLKKDYIRRYRDAHGVVPIWLLARTMTFGCYARFYRLQTDRVHERTRQHLAKALDRLVEGSEIDRALSVLPDFRNACAHGERLYRVKVGDRPPLGFDGVLESLRSVICEREFLDFAGQIQRTVASLDAIDRFLGDTLLDGMGLTREWIAGTVGRASSSEPAAGAVTAWGLRGHRP